MKIISVAIPLSWQGIQCKYLFSHPHSHSCYHRRFHTFCQRSNSIFFHKAVHIQGLCNAKYWPTTVSGPPTRAPSECRNLICLGQRFCCEGHLQLPISEHLQCSSLATPWEFNSSVADLFQCTNPHDSPERLWALLSMILLQGYWNCTALGLKPF